MIFEALWLESWQVYTQTYAILTWKGWARSQVRSIIIHFCRDSSHSVFSIMVEILLFIVQTRVDDIAQEIFDRLDAICPTCGYNVWRAVLRSPSVTCSTAQNILVFRSDISTCSGEKENCSLLTHLEFFHSLDPPFLFIESVLFLLDSSCPLYANSLRSTDCLSGDSVSSSMLAGAVIGGLIFGALIGICIIFIIILVVWIRRKKSKKYDETPHPMTSVAPRPAATNNTTSTRTTPAHTSTAPQSKTGKASTTAAPEQLEESGYEFIPFAGRVEQQHDIEYAVPNEVLVNLPRQYNDNQQADYEEPDVQIADKASSKKNKKGNKMTQNPSYVKVDKEETVAAALITIPTKPQPSGRDPKRENSLQESHDYTEMDMSASQPPLPGNLAKMHAVAAKGSSPHDAGVEESRGTGRRKLAAGSGGKKKKK